LVVIQRAIHFLCGNAVTDTVVFGRLAAQSAVAGK